MTTSNKRQEVISALAEKSYRDAYVAAEINTTLPFQIRATRDRRGWTQSDLAQRTGQDQRTISQFENPNYGKLTLTSLKRLASAFDVALVVRFVPFSELVDWTTTVSADRMAVPSFDEDAGLSEGDTTSPSEQSYKNIATSGALISSLTTATSWAVTTQPRAARMLKVTKSEHSGLVTGAASTSVITK